MSSEELKKEVMKVFPSLDSFKAGFLISVFGEENTQELVADVQEKLDEIKRMTDKLTSLS